MEEDQPPPTQDLSEMKEDQPPSSQRPRCVPAQGGAGHQWASIKENDVSHWFCKSKTLLSKKVNLLDPPGGRWPTWCPTRPGWTTTGHRSPSSRKEEESRCPWASDHCDAGAVAPNVANALLLAVELVASARAFRAEELKSGWVEAGRRIERRGNCF